MEKNFQDQVNAMNEMVVKGELINAGEKYFAQNIKTIEFDGTTTIGKQAVMKKLIDFMASIKKVNKLELLLSAADDNASFSEYLLDFDMKDGSNFSLHEIIRSLWENGQVIEERYFKG
ncbi:hypothetical protein [Arachidicoccus sp.]|uniref:hypothetical protein n=1 Tax=Arachidicoccus sp. TaxID=1872624 RepID=UPI003D1AF8DE